MNDPLSSGKRLTVAVATAKSKVSKPVLEAFASSVRRLGHAVTRDPKSVIKDPEAVTFTWNGKGQRKPAGRTIYCENGWLPRWEFQVAELGINAASSLAPYPGIRCNSRELHFTEKRLARLRDGERAGNFAYDYALAEKEPCGNYEYEFLLAPLQMPQDTNMRHVPRKLKRAQNFVEYLAELNPPLPILFKQHPMDANHGNEQLLLRMCRKGDWVHPHRDGNIHQLLKTGLCRGIVTLNSNVVHDGLLWGVPSLAFGRGIWGGPGSEHSPFLTDLKGGWGSLLGHLEDPEVVERRKSYAYWLFKQQWTVERAENLGHVSRLLAGRTQ